MTREEAMGIIYLDLMCASGKLATLTDDDFEEVNILKRKIKALDMAHNALKKALQERPKGRWIEEYKRYIDPLTGECEEEVFFKCPICGRYEFEKEPFCNCGADMRESE